jgi:hypothetical protein
MTGEPLEDAEVYAFNCEGYAETLTNPDGSYGLVLPYDPNCTTNVFAGAEGYNPATDTVSILECGDFATISFQLHQTPKSRVLLYYGNGGWDNGDDYNELAGLFEDLGYYVDYTGDWPTAFDWTLKYELIVLLGPGHANEDLGVNGFTIGQKADLDRYLQQEGKLVILSDATSVTGVGVENDLLNALPVDLQFDAANFTSGHGDQITANCLTGNIQVYSARDAGDNWTSVSGSELGAVPGDLIHQNPGSTSGPGQEMYAMDVPSHGNGWVAILGDLHGLTDASYMSDFNWSADNEWIPLNWIVCPTIR